MQSHQGYILKTYTYVSILILRSYTGTNVYFGKVVTMTLNMSAIASIGSDEGMDTNNANAFLIFLLCSPGCP